MNFGLYIADLSFSHYFRASNNMYVLGSAATSRNYETTTTASPSRKTHAQFRAFHRAFGRARANFPIHSIIKRDKRARHTIPYFPTAITFHVKYATQHLHQNCLYTLTSSYRRMANNYTLLLNASTTYTTCWSGVESSYTPICLPIRYTAMVEHIPLRPNILTYRTL